MSEPPADIALVLQAHLKTFSSRSGLASRDTRDTIEDLVKIHRNILSNPNDKKFRVLRLGNPRIQNIVKFPELEVFLHRVGWDRVYQEGEEILLFSLQNNLLQQAVSALGNCRVISPRASEWVPETKVIVRNPAVERDLNLRAEAAKVRDKEYKEALKELEEKKQIAQQIREEHRNDRYRRLVRSPQPASPLPKDLAAKNRSPPAHTTGRGY